MIPKTSLLVPLCLVAGCFAAPLLAQERADADKKKVSISLLAVGDLPPIKYQATAHGPVFIEPPKEDFPPPMLFVKSKAKKGGFDQLQLGLNTPMAPIMHPGGKVMKIYQDKADALASEDGSSAKESYLKVALPDEMADLTVLVVRNPSTKSWRSTPRSYAFKNDQVSFPPNSVRIVNLSSNPMKGKIAGTVIGLSPSSAELSAKIIPVSCPNHVLEFEIVGGIKGKAVVVARTATSFYDGSRLNMVIYDGDSKDAAGAMKMCSFVEPPLQKPAPPKPPVPATTATAAAAPAPAPAP